MTWALKIQKLDLLRIEIDCHKWSGMTCGCSRSAEHTPHDFLDTPQKPAEPNG
jgi:hypothetical protein